MSLLIGDTGKVAFGTLKTTNITLPTVRETPITQVTLPTTEPGTPQISYTVQSSDLAIFSGNVPSSVVHVPFVYSTGQAGASATIISYRILLNGASQSTGSSSSITAGQYYTIEQMRYIPVNVGDVITVSLWSNQADTTFNYHAFTTCYTRIQLTKPGVVLKDVSYGGITALPILTQGPTPIAVASTQNPVIYPTNNVSTSVPVGTNLTFGALTQDPTYNLLRCNYGDSTNNYQLGTHATNKTQYHRNNIFTQITFREVLR